MEELKPLMLDSIEDVLTWIIGEKNILDNSLFAGQISNDQFKQRWQIAEKRALNAIMAIKDSNTLLPPATAGKSVDVGKLKTEVDKFIGKLIHDKPENPQPDQWNVGFNHGWRNALSALNKELVGFIKDIIEKG